MSSIVDENDIDEYAGDYEDDGTDGGGVTAVQQYFASCGTCQASYILDPADLGDGRRVKCAVCSNIWFQSVSRLEKLTVSLPPLHTTILSVPTFEGRNGTTLSACMILRSYSDPVHQGAWRTYVQMRVPI